MTGSGLTLTGYLTIYRRGRPTSESRVARPCHNTGRVSDESGKVHRPGEVVQGAGIYQGDCGRPHRYSTDVKGHRVPPLPGDSTGSGWTLRTAAQHRILADTT
ncbi:hypothetical protein Shyhy02_42250 [Streptomyces hygroscopicus subsp. hygroscopicus]|nr:hypothetical protein Shyhy02_42250 [Streptomyces hygroscopicus subsp. hygroscopicus]